MIFPLVQRLANGIPTATQRQGVGPKPVPSQRPLRRHVRSEQNTALGPLRAQMTTPSNGSSNGRPTARMAFQNEEAFAVQRSSCHGQRSCSPSCRSWDLTCTQSKNVQRLTNGTFPTAPNASPTAHVQNQMSNGRPTALSNSSPTATVPKANVQRQRRNPSPGNLTLNAMGGFFLK